MPAAPPGSAALHSLSQTISCPEHQRGKQQSETTLLDEQEMTVHLLDFLVQLEEHFFQSARDIVLNQIAFLCITPDNGIVDNAFSRLDAPWVE